MRRAWLTIRSAALWAVSLLHFGIAVPVLIALAIFLDPRKYDWIQRGFCRRIVRLSGAKLEVRRALGFDPLRTCFFIVNHVNLFDPFVLYCAIPQHVRGWELESHFKIPVYGWLMKRFGNVPVPDARRPSDLKRLWRMTQEAIAGGTSLIVFPEAKRTRDGQVGEFEEGVFRLAQQLGVSIVPASLVGSFQHHNTQDWMLRPATITVHLHDTIETVGMKKEEVPALCSRVQELVAKHVEAPLERRTVL